MPALRRLSLLCCVCALSCAPVAAHHDDKPSPLKFDRTSDGWPVPDFSLIDQHGDALTRHRLLGQWTFVLFGDTHCAAPCTGGLSTLSALRARIARAQVVHSTQLLFVSLDPARDDATRIKAYLAPYDSELVGATGSAQMLSVMADEFGVNPRDGYNGALVLVGPEGLVRAMYLPPYDVRLLTADYLLKRARRR